MAVWVAGIAGNKAISASKLKLKLSLVELRLSLAKMILLTEISCLMLGETVKCLIIFISLFASPNQIHYL